MGTAGNWCTFGYDAQGNVSVSYTYDGIGRRTGQLDDSGQHTFTYDVAGNLTGADHPANYAVPDETFGYDIMGNRISWDGNPAAQVSYDAANRLTRMGKWVPESPC